MLKTYQITYAIPTYNNGRFIAWVEYHTKVSAHDQLEAISDFWVLWSTCHSCVEFACTRVIETRLVG